MTLQENLRRRAKEFWNLLVLEKKEVVRPLKRDYGAVMLQWDPLRQLFVCVPTGIKTALGKHGLLPLFYQGDIKWRYHC